MRPLAPLQDLADRRLGNTKVMEQVSMKLYELDSEQTRKREEEVRPGDPFEIAAIKTDRLLGLGLSEEQTQRLAVYGFHYGLGLGWGPTYTFLRRSSNLGPIKAGLLSGAAMTVLVDEGLTPLLGFSAPNRDYPLAAHLRGLSVHLAFGLGVAITTEAIYRIFALFQQYSEKILNPTNSTDSTITGGKS